MTKWICKNENCGKNCELSIDYQPIQCPRGLVWVAKWQEMEELNKGFVEKAMCEAQEKIAGKSPALPKLTAEVFDREDCPEWAQWAAVDSCGDAYFYMGKPRANSQRWNDSVRCDFYYIDKFDASDWQKSLIERPAKLPDWCKQDAVGWHKRAGYFKVTYVDVVDNRVDIRKIDDKSIGYLSFHTVCNEVLQANLRPFNTKEMKALVGRTVSPDYEAAFLVTKFVATGEGGEVCVDDIYYTADKLLDEFTINNKPAGVLEHIADGEWVE